MDLSIKEYGDIVVVVLRGVFDAVAVPKIEDFLKLQISQSRCKIVLNMQEINYISSAGIRLILSLFKLLQGLDGRLCICCVQDQVAEVLRIAGVDQLLSLCHSEQECFSKF
ncbi:STAS domain-containing protein [Chlamydia sp. 17-3921]|uniref:STAS domain-containing protein n=1 Tax=Chlamydia sp. 17-3921 TaxID=2675798 RepID=UPI00191A02CB|nr:STAS domain-containing protein [Chlamydia sp. 17-3921]